MKKLLSVLLLITLLAALPAVLLPVRAQAQTGQENWSVLLIVSLDKKLPKGGKTNGMGYYLMTYHREGSRLSFTSFPYNLSVELPGKKGPVRKQLQFACKELGPEGAADLISQTFGIKIDYWVLINLNALVELVDLAGGVEVNLANLSINKKAGEIKYMVSKPFKKLAEAGLQRLDGVQAMAYISDTLYDNPTISEEERVSGSGMRSSSADHHQPARCQHGHGRTHLQLYSFVLKTLYGPALIRRPGGAPGGA